MKIEGIMEKNIQKIEATSPEAQAQEEKRRQLAKMLAAIERRVEEENSRPKKRYLSPATLGTTYALYYDELRRKIEADAARPRYVETVFGVGYRLREDEP